LDHLVRNAADHAIERPAERRRLGKPESGRIAIEAHRSHGHLVVEIRDDGRGLDHGRIADAAVSRGLVGIADAARLSVARLERQIFAPGLSTAASTSLVSGRGVGLDAARTAIERLGGSIAVDSTRGCGTRFTIRLPLPEMVTPAGESQPGPTAGSAFTRQGSSGNDKAGGGEVAAAKGSAEILRRTATPGGFTRDLQKDHES
jgi:two-component system chemotaxis sensor kinase CheA